jgi:photosynthetic reaction center cytochrome c subunit
MNKEPLLLPVITGAVVAFGALGLWFTATKTNVTQQGYPGVALQQVVNARTAAKVAAANVAPEAQPKAEPGGQRASQVYQNVKVLGHLTENEFLRLMTAITEWVSPEEGCTYCHNPENLAADTVYTKIVSRRMLEMTQTINDKWKPHVGQTGVTCYTCHRGKPVPAEIWFTEPEHRQAGRMLGDPQGQNAAGVRTVAYSSLPKDPLTPFLVKDTNIRVNALTALPEKGPNPSIKQTEWTFALMMHMSNSLGVNCTYCHNTRAVHDWAQSPPARTTAWHGIRMVRELNNAYLDPLKPTYPAERLGPTGDAPKANCTTCHQGVNKPLAGAAMLKDYPELLAPKR